MSTQRSDRPRALVPVGARGFHWQWPPDVQPAVIAAAVKTMPRQDRTWRSRHAYWALDADYAPGFRYRAQSYRSPWRQREARTVHLYAPQTTYWEDVSRIETPHLRSRGLLFLAASLPRCEAWIKPANDFAIIHDPHDELGGLIERIVDIGHEFRERGAASAQAVLWEIIARLQSARRVESGDLRLESAQPHTPPGEQEPPFVQAVHAFLRAHLTEPLTLADLGRHLDLSVSTISHRYRAETGSTPMKKLIQMRLDLAKGMLVRGDRLQHIAEQTGFSDAFHLSKSFARHVGVSPRRFRHRHQRPNGRPGE